MKTVFTLLTATKKLPLKNVDVNPAGQCIYLHFKINLERMSPSDSKPQCGWPFRHF